MEMLNLSYTSYQIVKAQFNFNSLLIIIKNLKFFFNKKDLYVFNTIPVFIPVFL